MGVLFGLKHYILIFPFLVFSCSIFNFQRVGIINLTLIWLFDSLPKGQNGKIERRRSKIRSVLVTQHESMILAVCVYGEHCWFPASFDILELCSMCQPALLSLLRLVLSFRNIGTGALTIWLPLFWKTLQLKWAKNVTCFFKDAHAPWVIF